jgi:hypothetical protein
MKSSDLDDAMSNPEVYLDAFRRFNLKIGANVNQLLVGNFSPYGAAVAGPGQYGAGTFTSRCVALRNAMLSGGVTASA